MNVEAVTLKTMPHLSYPIFLGLPSQRYFTIGLMCPISVCPIIENYELYSMGIEIRIMDTY